MQLNCNGRLLDLSEPVVMGVLNVTPDSFSDGGRFMDPATALAHARQMVSAGAAIIDVGGESTRPGAAPVSEQAELDRVLPIIEALAGELDAVISIDTMKPAVMRAACDSGASLINDVNALQAEGAMQAAADSAAAVCLMHMQGEPRSMQANPQYQDVVADIGEFLRQRVQACLAAGIAADRLVLDPGFGFGKSLEHNLQLLANLSQLHALKLPLLVGMSRKSMLGALLDVPPAERIYGGAATTALAVWQGAHIIRTHDVRATLHAVKVAAAVKPFRQGEL